MREPEPLLTAGQRFQELGPELRAKDYRKILGCRLCMQRTNSALGTPNISPAVQAKLPCCPRGVELHFILGNPVGASVDKAAPCIMPSGVCWDLLQPFMQESVHQERAQFGDLVVLCSQIAVCFCEPECSLREEGRNDLESARSYTEVA